MQFYIWLYPVWQAYYDGDKTRKPFMETSELNKAVVADVNSMIVTIIKDGEHIGIKASDPRVLKEHGIL